MFWAKGRAEGRELLVMQSCRLSSRNWNLGYKLNNTFPTLLILFDLYYSVFDHYYYVDMFKNFNKYLSGT